LDEERDLVTRCLDLDPKAQKDLYNRYVSRMFGICLRYSASYEDAQDLLQDGFVRVFDRLKCFRFEGSLEGWIRRCFISVALNKYHREGKFRNTERIDAGHDVPDDAPDVLSRMSRQDLLRLIQLLPTGYRTVFNLYVIEGFKHREIGEMLGISENTSKTQLAGAKRNLRELLYNHKFVDEKQGRGI